MRQQEACKIVTELLEGTPDLPRYLTIAAQMEDYAIMPPRELNRCGAELTSLLKRNKIQIISQGNNIHIFHKGLLLDEPTI